jgi:hypothetical protein
VEVQLNQITTRLDRRMKLISHLSNQHQRYNPNKQQLKPKTDRKDWEFKLSTKTLKSNHPPKMIICNSNFNLPEILINISECSITIITMATWQHVLCLVRKLYLQQSSRIINLD